MKRLIALLLTATLIFGMSACKKREPNKPDQDNPSGTESSSSSTEESTGFTETSGEQGQTGSESTENTENTENTGESGTGNTTPPSGNSSGGTDTPGNGQDTPDDNDPYSCESADDFLENMGAGWNLGCSLSVYSDDISAWRTLVFFTTTNRKYNRSAAVYFDTETKSATITWKPGRDDGVLNADGSASIAYFGVELWNFSLSEKDSVTYRIDELKYITANGEIAITEGIGQKTTDMGGGTGGGAVASVKNLTVADVLEVRAKITYISQTSSASPEERIERYEKLWGNPVTTPEMIAAVRDKGFNTIRAQVSFVNHMDSQGNIDPYWLERVAEVVDYCMDAGVYCIINTSGAGWLTAERSTFEKQSAIYRRLWEQIAARFADYSELLLFESCNEVLNAQKSWSNPQAESYAVMNDLYQIFVDTVRAGGGYNANRNLILNPYAATANYEMNRNFKLPTDSAKNHLIAQVHLYLPGEFTFNETNLGHTNFRNEWGTTADKNALDSRMKGIKTRFIDELGIPVIIGEFGVVKRPPESERIEYIDFYVKTAKKYGIGLVVFDDGSDFAIFDRDTLTWPYESIIDTLLQ